MTESAGDMAAAHGQSVAGSIPPEINGTAAPNRVAAVQSQRTRRSGCISERYIARENGAVGSEHLSRAIGSDHGEAVGCGQDRSAQRNLSIDGQTFPREHSDGSRAVGDGQ